MFCNGEKSAFLTEAVPPLKFVRQTPMVPELVVPYLRYAPLRLRTEQGSEKSVAVGHKTRCRR